MSRPLEWIKTALLVGVSFSVLFLAQVYAQAEQKKPRVIYPKKTELDFEGIGIQGEVRSPGELYFQRRPQEKFDSLVKARRNFHPEVIRDIVQTR